MFKLTDYINSTSKLLAHAVEPKFHLDVPVLTKISCSIPPLRGDSVAVPRVVFNEMYEAKKKTKKHYFLENYTELLSLLLRQAILSAAGHFVCTAIG